MTTPRNPPTWVDVDDNPGAIDRMERTSILALLAYTAATQQVNEAIVREIFLTHFDIGDVMQLPRDAYSDAVRFLTDLKVGMIVN